MMRTLFTNLLLNNLFMYANLFVKIKESIATIETSIKMLLYRHPTVIFNQLEPPLLTTKRQSVHAWL